MPLGVKADGVFCCLTDISTRVWITTTVFYRLLPYPCQRWCSTYQRAPFAALVCAILCWIRGDEDVSPPIPRYCTVVAANSHTA